MNENNIDTFVMVAPAVFFIALLFYWVHNNHVESMARLELEKAALVCK